MTTVSELHEKAMNAADDMFAARRANRRLAAERAALDAFGLELRAATMAFDLQVSIRTRLILLRSMVSLAREASRWSEGMDLVMRALTMDDLRPFRDEVLHNLDILRERMEPGRDD